MKSLKNTFLSIFLFITSFYSSFSQAGTDVPSQSFEYRLQQIFNEQDEPSRLHQLFDLFWDTWMVENLEEAAYYGLPEKADQWPDFSPSAFERRSRINQQLIDAMASIQTSKLDEEDQISYGILKSILEIEQKNDQFSSHYLLVNQMFGIHLSIPLWISFMPARTVQNYEDMISRFNLLPDFFEQIIALLEQGLAEGITPPNIAIRNVPQQILNQMENDPLDSHWLESFKNFPSSIDSETQSRLLKEATFAYQNKVLPSMQRFHSFISERYIPGCRSTIAFSDLPNGANWYAFMVKNSTTTDLSPQEIHEIGLKEVERIHGEMLTLIQSTGFNGTFASFLNFLKTDPQFYFSSSEEVLNAYRLLTRRIESKLPLLFADFPSLPFEVIPVPSYSEETQGAAYYLPGSAKENRPGYFFINTSFPEYRAKWEMEPLALHEAVPGHHLQIAIAQELTHLPTFRKNISLFTAYIEGWGLYSESLGSELGFYQDPYSIFGRLNYEMMRAIRLVVDTGMHAMGWSREQAINYFKQYLSLSDHEITTEVDRYLVMPGQALAYKIGELKIWEMRKRAAQELGDKFDIREFHHEWLKHGTVPLDIIEQQIIQWIEKKKLESAYELTNKAC